MKTEEKFEKICFELMESSITEHVSFHALCSQMQADEKRMNNLFYEKFGMSGEEVFNKFLLNFIVIAV